MELLAACLENPPWVQLLLPNLPACCHFTQSNLKVLLWWDLTPKKGYRRGDGAAGAGCMVLEQEALLWCPGWGGTKRTNLEKYRFGSKKNNDLKQCCFGVGLE